MNQTQTRTVSRSTRYEYWCGHSARQHRNGELCPVCGQGELRAIEGVSLIVTENVPVSPERRLQQNLRAMIDGYLNRGWVITRRDPLTMYRGKAGYQLQNGCLVSV